MQRLLRIENQGLCRDLAERGLRWWRRPLYRGEKRQFLLTLAAEGGIPSRLLIEGGDRFRRFLEWVVDDVAAYGLNDTETVAQYAAGHDARLPAAFRREPVHLVVADLALWIHGARAAMPTEARLAEPLRWLELNRPDLLREAPLRLDNETARALLREELRRAPRTTGASGQLATRMLEVGADSVRPAVLIAREAALEQRGPMAGLVSILHEHDLLSARLRPAGSLRGAARDLIIALSPGEDRLWSATRRSGQEWVAPVPLSEAVEMEVTASGRSHGFVELLPAHMGEEAQIWREPSVAADEPARLELMRSRRVRTRRERLYLTTEVGFEPVVEGTLTCALKIGMAEGVRFWELTGAGRVSVGETRFDVRTGAETEEASEIWPAGRIAPYVRTIRGQSVMLGTPDLYLSQPGGILRRVKPEDLLWRPTGHGEWRPWQIEPPTLGEIDLRALGGGEPVAEIRLALMPEAGRIEARRRERAGAMLSFTGFAPAGEAVIGSSGSQQRVPLVEGRGETVLERDPDDGRGTIEVRLPTIAPGTAPLGLAVAYPRRRAGFVQPSGRFAASGETVATSRLAGWRAVAPAGNRAELRLGFSGLGAGDFNIYRSFENELPLFEVAEEIEGIMALTGPDTKVRLKIIAEGRETPEYLLSSRHDGALVLVAGGRQITLEEATDEFMEHLLDGGIRVQAFHVLAPDLVEELGSWNPIVEPRFDVLCLGAIDPGPWLIGASSADRSALRPVVVSFDGAPRGPAPRLPAAFTEASRQPRQEERTAAFAKALDQLLEGESEAEWTQIEHLIVQARASAVLPSLDLVQALARTPAAACALLLRASEETVDDVLALDRAVPVFWPAVPVRAWAEGVSHVGRGLIGKLCRAFPRKEAGALAMEATLDRTAAVARRAPEIGGHLARALLDNKLPAREVLPRFREWLSSRPGDELRWLMEDAVKRNGDAGDMTPWQPPADLPGRELMTRFHPRCNRLLAAPLIVARGAAGDGLGLRELLDQRLLALMDREYFSRAMPLALQICMESGEG